MKIECVDTYQCDNPRCGRVFTVSNVRKEKTLHIVNALVARSQTAFSGFSGRNYCKACTAEVLDILGD